MGGDTRGLRKKKIKMEQEKRINEMMPYWGIRQTGYIPVTSVWENLFIAEKYGEEDIKKTVEGEFGEYKNDYKQLTELALALNWKVWTHAKDRALSKLYEDLYEKTDRKAVELLEGDELRYYYEKTIGCHTCD